MKFLINSANNPSITYRTYSPVTTIIQHQRAVGIMSVKFETSEQRDFRRHQAVQLAWVLLQANRRIACIIRNFSPQGALLEFDHDLPGADEFELLLDQDFTTVKCTVSHRLPQAIGVEFVKVEPPSIRRIEFDNSENDDMARKKNCHNAEARFLNKSAEPKGTAEMADGAGIEPAERFRSTG